MNLVDARYHLHECMIRPDFIGEMEIKMEKDLEKIAQMIANVLNIDPREVTMETTFMGDLGADSLDVFQIVAEIEEEYHITITEEQAVKIQTVKEAIELIYRNREEKQNQS